MSTEPQYLVRGFDPRGGIPREYVIRHDGEKIITNIEEVVPLILEKQKRPLTQRGNLILL